MSLERGFGYGVRIALCTLAGLLVVAPSFGCRASELRVTVPRGFKRQVLLTCQTESSESMTGSVSASGMGSLQACPTSRARIYVIQNGHTSLVNGVQWNRTGDGIPTGITFAVR